VLPQQSFLSHISLGCSHSSLASPALPPYRVVTCGNLVTSTVARQPSSFADDPRVGVTGTIPCPTQVLHTVHLRDHEQLDEPVGLRKQQRLHCQHHHVNVSMGLNEKPINNLPLDFPRTVYSVEKVLRSASIEADSPLTSNERVVATFIVAL
ncbi:hypothetical protein MUK42_07193, partial [Musa troglodytarum]